jgi:hypothetical protein
VKELATSSWATTTRPVSTLRRHHIGSIVDPLTLIREIKPLLSLRLDSEQNQRPPFSQGQLLKGIISAKGEGNQFTLDIKGQQLTAESNTPLRVGQQLDLRVLSLIPRLELQVVDTHPVNRWLGNALPLLGQQSLLLPEVAAIAGDPRLMAQLSPTSQQTLSFYAGSEGKSLPGDAQIQSSPTTQLIDLLSSVRTTPSGQLLAFPSQDISALLQQLAGSPTLPPTSVAEALRLADLFSHTSEQKDLAQATPILVGTPSESSSNGSATGNLVVSASEQNGLPALVGTSLWSQLLPLVQFSTTLPDNHPLPQLLAFLIKNTTESSLPYTLNGAGTRMEETSSRLGLSMEQALANGRPEEAVRTLKYALLELSQRPDIHETGRLPPEQLGRIIEMYQLLQIRLAEESIYFLPLPFSFLQQGYLLIEQDGSRHQDETKPDPTETAGQTVRLHLQLEGLGNVQVDIRWQDNRADVRFLAENAEKAKFFAGFREELGQWLSSASLESVQFHVGAKEPVKAVLERITAGGVGVIDTKA